MIVLKGIFESENTSQTRK